MSYGYILLGSLIGGEIYPDWSNSLSLFCKHFLSHQTQGISCGINGVDIDLFVLIYLTILKGAGACISALKDRLLRGHSYGKRNWLIAFGKVRLRMVGKLTKVCTECILTSRRRIFFMQLRQLTQTEHNELLVYLEKLISDGMESTYGHADFMKRPSLKLANSTFSDLISNDVLEGLGEQG